jgi:hypothetical protein
MNRAEIHSVAVPSLFRQSEPPLAPLAECGLQDDHGFVQK